MKRFIWGFVVASSVACSQPSLSPTAGSAAIPGSTDSKSPDGSGCPAWGNGRDNAGVRFVGVLTPHEATVRSAAQITDAWYAAFGFNKDEYLADREAGVTAQDENADGLVCVAVTWGTGLNPNSHWAYFYGELLDPRATERWVVADNRTGR